MRLSKKNVPFWIVWSPSGEKPPKHRHYSQLSAVQEAERLASLHPGKYFYALACVGKAVLPCDVQVTIIDPFKHETPPKDAFDDDIPF